MTASPYKIYKIVPMLIIMGTIFFLSSKPGDEIHLPSFAYSDLVAHMIAYAALGTTVCFAWKDDFRKNQPLKACVFMVVFCLLYGISDEFHQYFVPGRSVSALDVCADTFGGVLASITWLFVKKTWCVPQAS
jgi:VanZ family protein